MQDQTNNYNKWMFMGSDYYSVCDTAIHYNSHCPLVLQTKASVLIAGSPGRVKSTFKYGDPLKIFVLMYKKILRKEIFHFEASYYPSQHPPHLPSSLS